MFVDCSSISTDTFEAASAYCRKFRPQLPPHYNQRRQFIPPIPSLNAAPSTLNTGTVDPVEERSNEDEQDEQSEQENSVENMQIDDNENELVDDDGTTTNNESHIGSVIANEVNEDVENCSYAPHSPIGIADEVDENVDEVDEKYNFPAVQIDADDVLMIAQLFDENSNVGEANEEENVESNEEECGMLAKIQLEENEKANIRDGKIIVTKFIDDESEMMYTYGEQPKIYPPMYQLKMNDGLSENIPFQENVNIFTKFII